VVSRGIKSDKGISVTSSKRQLMQLVSLMSLHYSEHTKKSTTVLVDIVRLMMPV